MSLIPRTNSLMGLDPFFDDPLPSFRLMPEGDRDKSLDVDITEKESAYVLKADFPGMKKDEISVSVQNNMLTLSGEHKEESEEKDKDNGRVLRRERRYGRISRSFNLGQKIDEEHIKASFDNGVLTLELPKAREDEKSHGKKIPIK